MCPNSYYSDDSAIGAESKQGRKSMKSTKEEMMKNNDGRVDGMMWNQNGKRGKGDLNGFEDVVYPNQTVGKHKLPQKPNAE